MTLEQLYNHTKALYSNCAKASEWFSLRALVGELMIKYGQSPDGYMLHPQNEADFAPDFLSDVRLALAGRPLQYITGRTAFWKGEFEVGEGVLIPRDDTERLVELALQRLKPGDVVYDLCCGSGCVGISLLMECPKTRCLLLDVSKTALYYAQRNATLNHVENRCTIAKRDILNEDLPEFARPDIMVSNPPYIPTEQLAGLECNVKQEPVLALDGGSDGCLFYRKITQIAQKTLKPDGFLLYEIAPFEKEQVQKILGEHGFSSQVFCDYRSNPRVVCAYKSI